MTTTTVYDATAWSAHRFHPDPRKPVLIDWLKANRIDPDHLPVDQRIALEDDTIRYVAYVVDDDGRKILNHDGDGPVFEPRATPCTVQPPDELTAT